MTAVPGWIWTGALTPQVTSVSLQGAIQVPKPGKEAYDFLPNRGFWSWENTTGMCWQDVRSNGSFTNCPAIYRSGDLIRSGGSASSGNNSARYHSKSDKTALSYIGRSYGVGAPAGLTGVLPSKQQRTKLKGYQYHEPGYLTTAKCIRNASSVWSFDQSSSQMYLSAGTWPSLFMVSGLFPNSNWADPNASYFDGGTVFFGQSGFGDSPDWVVSLGSINGWNVSITDYYLAIAAGSRYSELDKVQCELFFSPTTFSIDVSELNNTILVTPEGAASDIDPSGKLRANVMLELTAISMVETTTYVSTVGEALRGNIANVQNRNLRQNTNASEAEVLTAVEDFVIAMADDILEMLAGAVLSRAGPLQRQPATFAVQAVELGAVEFTVAIFVLNVAAFIALTIVAIKFKSWSKLSLFDITDPGVSSCATFLGASEKAQAEMHECLDSWTGDPQDQIFGVVSIRTRDAAGLGPPAVILSTTPAEY